MISGNINGSYFQVYPYGEIVLDGEPGAYYVRWTPAYMSSGSFNGWFYDYYDGHEYSVPLDLSIFTSGYCSGYYNLTYSGFNSMCGFIGYTAFYGTSITTIKTNVNYIGYHAFEMCRSLTSVRAEYCSYISNGAFGYCSELVYVSIPNVEEIKDYAFSHCKKLSEIDLPACTVIGQNVFSGCSSLVSISIPHCSYIGDAAFRTCRSLSEISLPECRFLGFGVFQGTSISSLYLPVCESVSGCFEEMMYLERVELPVCSIINGLAFTWCSNFSVLVLGYSGVCSFGSQSSRIFSDTLIGSGLGSIYVPSSLVSAYWASPDWAPYSSMIHPIL